MVELTIGIMAFLFVAMVIYLIVEWIIYRGDPDDNNNDPMFPT